MDQKQSPKRGPKLFAQRSANKKPVRRKKLPWPSGKPFKILSLDGGGIRGLYGASLLALIERNITDGEPAAHYFDMIAGTSTGGIIGVGLGLGIPAERIEGLYLNDGGKIFRQNWAWKILPGSKFFRHLRRTLYDHEVLNGLLYREFGDRTLGESVTRLVIPAFITPKTEIAVFKTDHHPDYERDFKSAAWEVARATSAAPTFLSGHDYDDVIFLDGGLWSNNPVMVAVIDALSAYDISVDQIKILSIGTGNVPFEITSKSAKKGLFRWREAIKAAMFLTTDNAHSQAALLLGPEKIIRLEPSKDAALIELDDWDAAVAVMPAMASKHFHDHQSDIGDFFCDKVAERDRFYTS